MFIQIIFKNILEHIFRNNLYFLSFLGHTIVNRCFKSYVLDFIPLWGSHSGSLLLQKYEETINTFGINHKVIRLVTDSSANNIHALKILLFQVLNTILIKMII